MLSVWKWIIVHLIIAAVTGTTMISAANVSSSRTIQSWGTIVYRIQVSRVSIIDVAKVSRAFGSYSGQERWNPSLGINWDGQVNELDLSLITQEVAGGK